MIQSKFIYKPIAIFASTQMSLIQPEARVLVCRRRVFANRVVRLWVQDTTGSPRVTAEFTPPGALPRTCPSFVGSKFVLVMRHALEQLESSICAKKIASYALQCCIPSEVNSTASRLASGIWWIWSTVHFRWEFANALEKEVTMVHSHAVFGTDSHFRFNSMHPACSWTFRGSNKESLWDLLIGQSFCSSWLMFNEATCISALRSGTFGSAPFFFVQELIPKLWIWSKRNGGQVGSVLISAQNPYRPFLSCGRAIVFDPFLILVVWKPGLSTDMHLSSHGGRSFCLLSLCQCQTMVDHGFLFLLRRWLWQKNWCGSPLHLQNNLNQMRSLGPQWPLKLRWQASWTLCVSRCSQGVLWEFHLLNHFFWDILSWSASWNILEHYDGIWLRYRIFGFATWRRAMCCFRSMNLEMNGRPDALQKFPEWWTEPRFLLKFWMWHGEVYLPSWLWQSTSRGVAKTVFSWSQDLSSTQLHKYSHQYLQYKES